jgi:hypothetical protein
MKAFIIGHPMSALSISIVNEISSEDFVNPVAEKACFYEDVLGFLKHYDLDEVIMVGNTNYYSKLKESVEKYLNIPVTIEER